MRTLSPRIALGAAAVMFLAGAALAAFGLNAARTARQPVRHVAVVNYSGPMSGELIDDPSPLRRVLPEVKLDTMTLGQAIDALRRLSGTNIFVNWRRLSEGPDVGPGTPVEMDLRLKDVALDAALAKVLDCAHESLGFGVRDGIVTVSDEWPKHQSREVSFGRWYFVQDLLNDPAHYGAARPANEQARQPPTAGPFSRQDDHGGIRQEVEDELTQLVMESIDPESWRDNGGADGSIRAWAGRLIIHQTAENHRKIESMLANLRKGP